MSPVSTEPPPTRQGQAGGRTLGQFAFMTTAMKGDPEEASMLKGSVKQLFSSVVSDD